MPKHGPTVAPSGKKWKNGSQPGWCDGAGHAPPLLQRCRRRRVGEKRRSSRSWRLSTGTSRTGSGGDASHPAQARGSQGFVGRVIALEGKKGPSRPPGRLGPGLLVLVWLCFGGSVGQRVVAVVVAPDDVVDRYPSWYRADSGDDGHEDEAEGQDHHGRPHEGVSVARALERLDLVPHGVEPQPGLAGIAAGLVHHAPLVAA